jgi:hypothetical protein
LQLINYFTQKKLQWEEAIKKPQRAKDLKVLLAKADQQMELNQRSFLLNSHHNYLCISFLKAVPSENSEGTAFFIFAYQPTL